MPLTDRIDNRRVLIIDDNPAIHEDFRKILSPAPAPAGTLGTDEDEARIFGRAKVATAVSVAYDLHFAFQGQEGLSLILRSLEEKRPFAMAFVDVRMPPGWDGVETIARIWEVYPDLQVVICTAYSDYDWEQMVDKLGRSDRLLILKKPFDTIEILQQANAMTEKWRLQQESRSILDNLDLLVKQRTKELNDSRMAAMSMMEEAVRSREKEKQTCEDLRREAVERLKLEERFRERASLLDMTRDAILLTDLEQRVTYWNKGAERVYGWTAEEVTGHCAAGLSPKDAAGFAKACNQVMQSGEWIGELRQVRKDGADLTVHGHWTLLRGAGGEPKSILAVNTDVTEHKKLEQQLLRLQRLPSIGSLASSPMTNLAADK